MTPRVAGRNQSVATLQEQLTAIYTPGEPIDDPELFSGRKALLAELRGELKVRGMHYVLYGERGVGKTSLWKVLLDGRRQQEHSASGSDDFVSIFLRVLEQLGEQFTEGDRKRLSEVSGSLGKKDVATLGGKLSEEVSQRPVAARALDLNFVLDRLALRAEYLDAIVIDEIQNCSKEVVQTQIIEVVKGLSDRKINVKILLVGVADSDEELIPSPEYPQYKGRHFLARHVPRMSDQEILDILDIRERRFKVAFEAEVKNRIAQISYGYPQLAHRLALNSSRIWVSRVFIVEATNWMLNLLRRLGLRSRTSIERVGIRVEEQDLRAGVRWFVEGFKQDNPKAVQRYEEALQSEAGMLVQSLLLAVASSKRRRMGVDQLAEISGVSSTEVDALLASLQGLVARLDNEWKLVIQHMRPYIEACSYLDT